MEKNCVAIFMTVVVVTQDCFKRCNIVHSWCIYKEKTFFKYVINGYYSARGTNVSNLVACFPISVSSHNITIGQTDKST